MLVLLFKVFLQANIWNIYFPFLNVSLILTTMYAIQVLEH